MHYSAKLRIQLPPCEVGHFGRGCLWQDSCDRFTSLGDMNFADFGGPPKPFARIVVKFANGYRLHVTHRVTLTWNGQFQRLCVAR